MSIVVLEAIKRARTDLKISTAETGVLLDRLETIERVLPLSPDETWQSCLRFKYAIQDWAGCSDCADSLYGIGNDLFMAIKFWYDSNKLAFRAGRKYWDRGNVNTVCVGRWESRGGKHWAELWWGRFDYSYRSNNSGGSVCNPNMMLDQALTVMQAKLDRGMFLPDIAVVPMGRVK